MFWKFRAHLLTLFRLLLLELSLQMKAFDGVTVSKDELGGVEIDKSPEDLADEREYQELMKRNSLFDEITFALYESRFMAPIIALLGILLAYHLTIAPHQTYVDKTEKLNINLVRELTTPHMQLTPIAQ